MLLRQTENWDQLDSDEHLQRMVQRYQSTDEFTYTNQDGTTWREKLLSNLTLWKSYTIPYPKYRHELKEIARPTWRRVAPITHGNFKINHGLIMLPTDDDDLFAPNVVKATLPFFEDPEIDIVIWDSWRFDTTFKPLLTKVPCYKPDGTIFMGSNCYMLRSTLGKNYMYNHEEAGEFVLNNPQKTIHLSAPLSIYNLHAGGRHFLRRIDFSPCPIEDLPPIPNELQWAKRSIGRIYRLRKQLQYLH